MLDQYLNINTSLSYIYQNYLACLGIFLAYRRPYPWWSCHLFGADYCEVCFSSFFAV